MSWLLVIKSVHCIVSLTISVDLFWIWCFVTNGITKLVLEMPHQYHYLQMYTLLYIVAEHNSSKYGTYNSYKLSNKIYIFKVAIHQLDLLDPPIHLLSNYSFKVQRMHLNLPVIWFLLIWTLLWLLRTNLCSKWHCNSNRNPQYDLNKLYMGW